MLWNSGAQIRNNGPEEVLYDNTNACRGGVKSTVLTIAQQEPDLALENRVLRA